MLLRTSVIPDWAKIQPAGKRNKNIKTIIFHLDNDEVGIGATSKIIKVLSKKYRCIDDHPKESKDVNEELVSIRI